MLRAIADATHIGAVLGPSSNSPNTRTGERHRLANALAPDPFDLKPCSDDCLLCPARQMAVPRETLPDRLDALLPLQSLGVSIRSHMFEKYKAATGPQHTEDLCQRRMQGWDRAEHERCGDRIEGRGGHRQRFDGRIRDLNPGPSRGSPPGLQPAPHMGIGLGKDEAGNALRIVRDADSGTRSDLQHLASQTLEEFSPPLSEAGLLTPSHESVIDRGHQPRHNRTT